MTSKPRKSRRGARAILQTGGDRTVNVIMTRRRKALLTAKAKAHGLSLGEMMRLSAEAYGERRPTPWTKIDVPTEGEFTSKSTICAWS